MAAAILSGCTIRDGDASDWENDAAILVPRMEMPPVLDREMKPGEWSQAHLISGTFVIDDGSKAAGEYPFRLWIGGDDRNLYVAAVVNATRNPWSYVVEDEDGQGWKEGAVWYPDFLELFFTNGAHGNLTVPSDWKSFSNSMEQGSNFYDGFWNGRSWTLQDEGSTGGNDFNDGQPTGGTWGRGGYTNATLFWEIYIPRQPLHKGHDGLRVGWGDVFRMGLVFSRQEDEIGKDGYVFHRDAYPGPGYTPDDYLHPETWMKLRLDF